MDASSANELLYELLEILRKDGSPTLAWAVEHASNGEDFVAEAWVAATYVACMRMIAREIRHPMVVSQDGVFYRAEVLCRQNLLKEGEKSYCALRGEPRSTCADCLRSLRKLVPRLTAADVLSACNVRTRK